MLRSDPPLSRVHAVLPIKSFARGKSRLSTALAAASRASLAQTLFERALDATLECSAISNVLIATDGEDVVELARRRGVAVLRDRAPFEGGRSVGEAGASSRACGLPAVVDRALDHLSARVSGRALVLMADLPHVSAGDLARLLSAPTRADVRLVPDQRGRGTNALCLPLGAGFQTHFGHPDSKREHLREAARRMLSVAVIECDGLALDLDRPHELAAAQLDAERRLTRASSISSA